MKKAFEQRLSLGETAILKGNIIEKRLRVVYTGQLDTNRYSIAVILTYGNAAFSYNLYFESQHIDIRMPYGMLTVLEADADSIYFMYRAD